MMKKIVIVGVIVVLGALGTIAVLTREGDEGEPAPDASIAREEVAERTVAPSTDTPESSEDAADEVEPAVEESSETEPEMVEAGKTDVDFPLRPIPGVKGVVLDKRTGRPVTQFQIASGQVSARTIGGLPFQDEQGEFFIQEEMTRHGILVRAKGYEPKSVDAAEVRAASGGVLRVLMGWGLVADGVVMDINGAPIQGTRIYMEMVPWRSSMAMGSALATTDSDGRFEVTTLPPSILSLAFHHGGYSLAYAAPAPGMRVVLQPPGVVEGLVTRDGAPVPDMQVGLRLSDAVTDAYKTSTNENGRYQFTNAPEGEVVLRIVVGTVQWNMPTLVVPSATTEVNFALGEATAVLEGFVTLGGELVPNGRALVDVYIETEDGLYRGTAGCDREGWYRIEGLPAGTAFVSVTANAGNRRHKRNDELDLQAGSVVTHDVDVPLGTGRLILNLTDIRSGDMGVVFVLVDHHVFDVVDQVTAREWLKYSIIYTWGLQEDTQFVLENMPPGKYTVSGASVEEHYATQIAVAMEHAWFNTHHIELGDGEEMVIDLVAP